MLYGASAGPNDWIIDSQFIYHNTQGRRGRGRMIPGLPNLYGLTPGQSVGVAVTPKGELYIFFNRKHVGQIVKDIPVDTPIWGVADICGRCTKIKSEILSGESCGVVYVTHIRQTHVDVYCMYNVITYKYMFYIRHVL